MPEYAFPGLNAQFTGLSSDGEERYEIAPSGGMTLRDYFAAKAIAGVFADSLGDKLYCEAIAERAYFLADAMLRAREKEPNS